MPTVELSSVKMFTAACYQFVQTIGKKTLHATPSLDEKDNVKLFQVVLKSKRRRFIFWEKSVFSPTEFQLTDILVDRSPLKTKQTTNDLVSVFNRTTKMSLKGKIGAEISKEIIDVELDASDTITLDIKFGNVKKQDLGEQDLIDELSNRHINMDHPYVKAIRGDKRNSLCMISGVAFLPDGGTIHRVTDEDLEATAKAAPAHGANASTGVEYVKDRDIGLAKDTAVAYNVHELDIDANTGGIQLVLAKDKHGGFRTCMGYDEVDAGPGDVSPTVDFQLGRAREVFFHFLDLDPKTRSEVNEHLLKLMENPRDVVVIADLLNNVEAGQEVNNSVSDLAKRVVSPREVWQYVLEQAGFSVVDDNLVIPQSTAKVTMFGEFFDAATVLEESLLELVTSLSSTHADKILTVLKYGIQGTSVTDESIVTDVMGDPTSHKMLAHLKYCLNEAGVIGAPTEVPFCIDALYWILFALYGK